MTILQGAKVKAIQEEHGVTVTYSRNDETLRINGTEDKIPLAREAIEEVVGKVDDTHISRVVDIPEGSSGSVIGPKGKTIKLLQETHKVSITLGRGMSAANVTLRGKDVNVEACEAAILVHINDTHRVSVQLRMQAGCVGALLGKGGSVIKKLQVRVYIIFSVWREICVHTEK